MRRFIAEVEHIARDKAARGVAAKLPKLEGGAAAEIGREIEPAGKQQVAAHAAARRAAQRKGLAGGDGDRLTTRNGNTVERGGEVRAGERDARGCGEGEGGAGMREFKTGGALGIAEQAVA